MRARAQARRFRVAYANLNDDFAAHPEALGFTGLEVRRSFEYAARTLPLDMIFYDNAGDGTKALANADDAVGKKVDCFIGYCADTGANDEIGRKLESAGIPALAVNYPIPGAPLYTADNFAAGKLAGTALGQYAKQYWANETVLGVIAGDLSDSGPTITERVRGITEGIREHLPNLAVTRFDTSGNPQRLETPLGRYLIAQARAKILIATLDDPAALAAKRVIEISTRLADCVIASQGLDRTIHGGANDRKEIDPNNRGSIVLGSVAYFLDRYGYEVLPLALKMLNSEKIPPRTTTKHLFVTWRNVFTIYPPIDMN